MKLAFLRQLYDAHGGYRSVYPDIFRAREDAAEAIGLRWRAARERLADSGADAATDSRALAEATEKIVADHAERTSQERSGQWHSELTRARAVEGLADTVAALSDGSVAEVFIAGDPSSTAHAWAGPRGTDLAVTARQLAERGISAPVRDRADAVIARPIACTDAELFFLPEDLPAPRDGIGATLRYPANLQGRAAMSGSTTAIWAIVAVAVASLAAYLLLVRYAAERPGHKSRRKEQIRGVVQGGQHVGGGRSVMPHRDAPVPDPETPDVEDMEGDAASRGRRPGSGSPMDL